MAHQLCTPPCSWRNWQAGRRSAEPQPPHRRCQVPSYRLARKSREQQRGSTFPWVDAFELGHGRILTSQEVSDIVGPLVTGDRLQRFDQVRRHQPARPPAYWQLQPPAARPMQAAATRAPNQHTHPHTHKPGDTPCDASLELPPLCQVIASRTFNVLPIVEGMYDMGNLAAVFRSADALGCGAVHCIRNARYKQSKRASGGGWVGGWV